MRSSPSSSSSSNSIASTAAAVATTAVTAGIMGLIGGYYYRSVTAFNHREMKTLKVPKSLLNSEYNEQLKLAVQLAMEAGSNMIEYLEAKGTIKEHTMDLGIETKSGAPDFCTKIDVENEKLIMEGIRKKFPNHEIIGEEGVGTGTIPALNPNVPTWIIDPIDGTTNFSAGLHSLTCVSIGYCYDGKPVVGVIYAPSTNELYVGVKGYGAYRNGQRIYQNPDMSTKSLQDAVVCNEMGYARNEKDLNTLLDAQKRLYLKGCRGFRQLGSGCLDLCYVASGRLDVVYAGICNEGWKPWDYAAGLIIVEEAGCYMESIDQDDQSKNEEEKIDPSLSAATTEFDLYSKSVICAVSKELVDELRSVIKS